MKTQVTSLIRVAFIVQKNNAQDLGEKVLDKKNHKFWKIRKDSISLDNKGSPSCKMTSFLVVKKSSFKPDSFEEINCVFNFFFLPWGLSVCTKLFVFYSLDQFWSMWSVPRWQKPARPEDVIPAAAGPGKSWNHIGIMKDHSGQNSGGGFSFATRWVTHLFTFVAGMAWAWLAQVIWGWEEGPVMRLRTSGDIMSFVPWCLGLNTWKSKSIC